VTDEISMNPLAWLEKTQPGFDQLSTEERDAIRDFSLLWSLYEGTVLAKSGSARAIVADVKSFKQGCFTCGRTTDRTWWSVSSAGNLRTRRRFSPRS
jgi:hypothetical protein